LKNINLEHIFVIVIFWYNQFLNHLLKLCPIFDSSLLIQNSKFNNFLWVCWFLYKNIFNFVPPFENSTTCTAIMKIKICNHLRLKKLMLLKVPVIHDLQYNIYIVIWLTPLDFWKVNLEKSSSTK
jgi:hypothetical protein